jgi:hypothetical protein
MARTTQMPVLRYQNTDGTWSLWHFIDLARCPNPEDLESAKQALEPLADYLQNSVEPGPIFPGPKRNQMGLLTMVQTAPGFWEPEVRTN